MVCREVFAVGEPDVTVSSKRVVKSSISPTCCAEVATGIHSNRPAMGMNFKAIRFNIVLSFRVDRLVTDCFSCGERLFSCVDVGTAFPSQPSLDSPRVRRRFLMGTSRIVSPLLMSNPFGSSET